MGRVYADGRRLVGPGLRVRGSNNTINGPFCRVWGDYNTLNGPACVAFGNYNTVNGPGGKAVGTCNTLNRHVNRTWRAVRRPRRKSARQTTIVVGADGTLKINNNK
jgi:hypothetical protein